MLMFSAGTGSRHFSSSPDPRKDEAPHLKKIVQTEIASKAKDMMIAGDFLHLVLHFSQISETNLMLSINVSL